MGKDSSFTYLSSQPRHLSVNECLVVQLSQTGHLHRRLRSFSTWCLDYTGIDT